MMGKYVNAELFPPILARAHWSIPLVLYTMDVAFPDCYLPLP